MSKLRHTLSAVFDAPVDSSTLVNYFRMVNEAGKINEKALLNLAIIALTYIEELEAYKEKSEANFKEIQEILGKLSGAKTPPESPVVHSEVKTIPIPPVAKPMPLNTAEQNRDEDLTCTQCGKVCASSLGLLSHLRTHAKKE